MDDYDVNNNVEIEVDSDDDSSGIIQKLAPYLATIITGLVVHFIDKRHEKKAVIEAYEKGIEEASNVYEKKLRALTEAFLNKEKEWKANQAEYEALINAYDAAIEELEHKPEKDKSDKNELLFLRTKKKELKKIKKVG